MRRPSIAPERRTTADPTHLVPLPLGGPLTSADKNSAAFDRFDPESETPVDMPTPRESYGTTYIGGRIVAVGGEDPTQVLGAAEMYDIAEKKWIKLAPLPTPRHAEVVAAVSNTVYVIGGANRPTPVSLRELA
jgi:serine/threonine-protein kinase PknK